MQKNEENRKIDNICDGMGKTRKGEGGSKPLF